MTQQLPPQYLLPPLYPAPGEVIDGKYRIERLLGEGGMGAVAKATHLLREAPVALKFMNPGATGLAGAAERFRNEAVAASRIESDHVVRIFDVGQLPSGSLYLVMDYLEGRDLAELLAREGTPGLDVPRAVHFTLQALRALQIAHSVGIVHRDMKPSNCFVVVKDGEPDFVKILDFGISKVERKDGGSLTRTNSALGTPLYMSPEQARSPRDVDHRSDLYSAGAVFYELLTGRPPYTAESGEFTEILFKIFTQDPPDVRVYRPELPEALAGLVSHAIARDPRNRYQSAAEMAEACAPWADGRSQQVLARIRYTASGGSASLRGASVPPPAGVMPFSIAPAASALSEATAKTHLSPESVAPAPLPANPLTAASPAVKTAGGMARDTTAAGGRPRRRSSLLPTLGAMLALLAA